MSGTLDFGSQLGSTLTPQDKCGSHLWVGMWPALSKSLGVMERAKQAACTTTSQWKCMKNVKAVCHVVSIYLSDAPCGFLLSYLGCSIRQSMLDCDVRYPLVQSCAGPCRFKGPVHTVNILLHFVYYLKRHSPLALPDLG